MIAVDTSAVYAIATHEPEHSTFAKLISGRSTVAGAPTLVELTMALSRTGPDRTDRFLSQLVREGELQTVDFTFAMFEAARAAFWFSGRGKGHPAQINFGDCLSYAVAKVRGLPLLFKGTDFAHTDIEPAWRP